MNASASYRLGEVGGFKDDPRYDIPPLEYRNGLELGARARLMVEFPDRAAPVWVQVGKVLGPGWYLGRAEDGAEVEFGSEHVFTIRGPEMGASSWLEFLPGGRPRREERRKEERRAQPPPPPPPRGQAQAPEAADARWFEFLPGASRSQKRPSLFDFWKTAPVDPVEPQAAPQPKRSFWDWLRRKPQVSIEPIPPAERRDRPTTIRLPYGAPGPSRQAPPEPEELPPEPPPRGQEPAQASPQAIIVPEAFRGGLVAPEGGFRPSGDAFSMFPSESEPEEAPEGRSGSGLIVAPEPPAPPAPPPQGLIVTREDEHLPAQVDAFSMLAPAPTEAFGHPAAAPAYDPFSMIAPAAEPFGPPAQVGPADPFNMIQPDPTGSFGPPAVAQPLTPFGMLAPAAEPPGQGMVVAADVGVSAFDLLEPQGGMVPAPAAAQPETVFDVLKPEPVAEKKSGRKKKPKAKKGFINVEVAPGQTMQVPLWDVPTHEEFVKFILDLFKPIENVWSFIRKERTDPWFLEAMAYDEYGGEPALIPIETWVDSWDWDAIFRTFDIVPAEIWEPYAEAMRIEGEQSGMAEAAWEAMQIEVLEPLQDGVWEAFKSIKPKDIPGAFIFAYGDSSGTWGLQYTEELDPKEAARIRREIEAEQKAEQLEGQRKKQEAIDEAKHRKAQIKKIWGAMPKVADLIPWIESVYDVNAMFKQIQKWRRTKEWKEDIKEYGANNAVLEIIADLGPKKASEVNYGIASYFGIPPDIVGLFDGADSTQRLWEEVFWPFLEVLSSAFTTLLEDAKIPGTIRVDEDQDDHLALIYTEDQSEE